MRSMQYRKFAIAAFAFGLIVLNLYAVALAQNATALSWKKEYFGLEGWRRTLVVWVDWNGQWLHAVALLPAALLVIVSMWRPAHLRSAAVLAAIASAVFVSLCLLVRNIAFSPFAP